MEQISYLLIGLFLLAIAAVSFIIGYRINLLSFEKLQRDLVDVHEILTEKIKLLIQTKKKWYDLARHNSEIEDALRAAQTEIKLLEFEAKQMRVANQQIAEENYQMGIKDGIQKGKIENIKQIGKSLIDDSKVLNEGGIVSVADPLINQVQNMK